MKSFYDKVVEMLKQNEEVELYKFVFTESGKLDFYTDKVYTAEDGDKITRLVVLASVFGVKYRLEKIKCIGTALVKGKSFLIRESLNDYYEPVANLYYGDIKGYSFSITEAMKERASSDSDLYFLGKNGILYAFSNEERYKDDIELLLSKGLISKLEDFKEKEKC